MRIDRPLLIVLTLIVSALMGWQLLSSWTEPQAQGQLNLFQSDLLLHASEWNELDRVTQGSPSLRTSFLGENPIQDALKNYESVRKSAQKELGASQRKKSLNTPKIKPSLPSTLRDTPQPQTTLNETPKSGTGKESKGQLIDELDLRLGILYTQTKDKNKALQTWTQLTQSPHAQASLQKQVPTAKVLLGLWSDPSQILPNAEQVLNKNLTGWFRFKALSRLYDVQQRQDSIQNLQVAEQETASSAFLRLLMVGLAPVLGSAIGFVILVVYGFRYLQHRQMDQAKEDEQDRYTTRSLSTDTNASESRSSESSQQGVVLWPTETIWQVMVLWFTAFFGVSFIVMPLIVLLLGIQPGTFDGRMQGYFALFSYTCLMVVGFSILQLSLQRFVPNIFRWLRLRLSGNWILWGLGGYFVALPIVLIVSLLNQKVLQDQGGGNPILEIILQSHDGLTIGLLWFLVAVCAPFFEESLFRGFFLTSLTRYLSTWQAIALSGLLFAIAHQNLGDLLPLTVLGMILGFVYLRSRNLLASMLLHSLWNSGSFLGLLILGSSNS
jgi:uncharacterized protein